MSYKLRKWRKVVGSHGVYNGDSKKNVRLQLLGTGTTQGLAMWKRIPPGHGEGPLPGHARVYLQGFFGGDPGNTSWDLPFSILGACIFKENLIENHLDLHHLKSWKST